jgi:Tfp pilus assembly PilM family ATPase/Tfp pilus assembly protein PilN
MKTDGGGMRKRKSVVAVEAGGDWLKLVQIDRGGKEPVVSRLYFRRMGEVDESSGPAMRSAIKTLNLASGPMIACLPRQMVNIRIFELPSGDPQEIADMIDLQIARQTPYSRDEIVFDYRLMRSERDGYTRVMLVIAQCGLLRQRFRMLEEAGCAIEIMTVSTEGLLLDFARRAAAATSDQAGGDVALLDVDSSYSDLAVVRGGGLIFSRSIVVGAHQLLTEREKWEAKFIQEVGHGLESFRNESSGSGIGKLVLSGAAARVPWVAERLRAELEIAVEESDGSKSPTVAPVRPTLDEAEHQEISVTGLIGAALAAENVAINLIPDSVRMRKALAVSAWNLTWFGGLVMAALVLLSVWIEGRLCRKEAYLADLRRNIMETEGAAKEIKAKHDKIALVTARLNTGLMPVTVLTELHKLVPEEIYFTAVELDRDMNNRVVLRGVANAVSDVVKFMSALEASPVFQDAKSTRTVTGKGKTEFEIDCNVETRKP